MRKPKPTGIEGRWKTPVVFVAAAAILGAAGGWIIAQSTKPEIVRVKSTIEIQPLTEPGPKPYDRAKIVPAKPLAVVKKADRPTSAAPAKAKSPAAGAIVSDRIAPEKPAAPKNVAVTVSKKILTDAKAPTFAVPKPGATFDTWQRNAVQVVLDKNKPAVTIIIDDLGDHRDLGGQVAALPGPLTMAFMPYTRYVDELVPAAKAGGHELLVHLPMQPSDSRIDPGPNALMTNVSPAELVRRISWNLDRFDGYVGVNNHMGSLFTTSEDHMRPVVAELKRRGLLFLDSKTSAQSVGLQLARRYGVPSIARDLFLDNNRNPHVIRAQLEAVLNIARRRGSAIGIGHPYPETIAALKEWLPDLAARGYQLVPLSAVVKQKIDVAQKRS